MKSLESKLVYTSETPMLPISPEGQKINIDSSDMGGVAVRAGYVANPVELDALNILQDGVYDRGIEAGDQDSLNKYAQRYNSGELEPGVDIVDIPLGLSMHSLQKMDSEEYGELWNRIGIERRWIAGANAVSSRSIERDGLQVGEVSGSSMSFSYDSLSLPDYRRGFFIDGVMHDDGTISNATLEIKSKRDDNESTLFVGEAVEDLMKERVPQIIAAVAANEGILPAGWKVESPTKDDYDSVKHRWSYYDDLYISNAIINAETKNRMLLVFADGSYMGIDGGTKEDINALAREWYRSVKK